MAKNAVALKLEYNQTMPTELKVLPRYFVCLSVVENRHRVSFNVNAGSDDSVFCVSEESRIGGLGDTQGRGLGYCCF